jgi:predicted TIM-barrel fold metal-dependent hydrolase
MAALTSFAPPSQMLFGTDYPYVPMAKTVGGFDTLAYGHEVQAAIDRDNAARLFPRFA